VFYDFSTPRHVPFGDVFYCNKLGENTIKKINIFNRNIDLPSYRRMPVSGGIVENRHTAEARCPGIATAMTCPAGDFSSQGDEKHNVCDASFCIRKNWVPAFAGMTIIAIAALFATPSFAEPTELDKKTVASKAYVDTKQNIIDTDLVEFYDAPSGETHNVPSLVSYGTGTNNNDGLLGNKIGIMSFDVFSDPLSNYSYNEMDNFVPTVRAVADALQNIWDSMPNWAPLTWNNTQSTAINAYNSTFGNGTNQWAGNSDHLINGQFLANSLALKQNKLPELDTNLVLGQAGQSVLAPTTAGNVTQVALWDADGAEPDAWDVGTYFSDATADERRAINYSIPTVGAVAVGLNQKQNKMVCAGWDSDTHTDEHCWLWSIE